MDISGDAMKVILRTVIRQANEISSIQLGKVCDEMEEQAIELKEVRDAKLKAEQECEALREECSVLNTRRLADQCRHDNDMVAVLARQSEPTKVGTWAWACEAAFANPGIVYGRDWTDDGPNFTVTAHEGQTFLAYANGGMIQVCRSDVNATDWREVTT